MLVPFRVLLPKRVFNKDTNYQDIHNNALLYMQRYPHYVLVKVENGFAICERMKEG